MKKLFGLLIFLSVIGLVACGKSSTSNDDEHDECIDNPELCGLTPEPGDDSGL